MNKETVLKRLNNMIDTLESSFSVVLNYDSKDFLMHIKSYISHPIQTINISHKEWEYKTIASPDHDELVYAVLEEEGKIGWELCAIDEDVLYFKREKINENFLSPVNGDEFNLDEWCKKEPSLEPSLESTLNKE